MSDRVSRAEMGLASGRSEQSNVVSLGRLRALEAPGGVTARPLVRVHLLGSMRATTCLGDDILPKGRKARAILGCLCLAGGERLHRARLSSMLWDRVPDAQARKSFRQSLRELVAAMGPLADELLSTDREAVLLDGSLCWIDVAALLAPQPPGPNSLRSELLSLCTGELLEELQGTSLSFDQWLLSERTRFTESLRTLLEAELAQVVQSERDPAKRANVARQLIAFDQTHEGASRALMRALIDMGERGQAVREYE